VVRQNCWRLIPTHDVAAVSLRSNARRSSITCSPIAPVVAVNGGGALSLDRLLAKRLGAK
jgi:hypothetical protein